MREWNLTLPLTEAAVRELRAGDRVKLTGVLYTGRDEAHMYLCRMLDAGEGLPFDLRDACIYYVGPCPAAPGQAIGSCGPTTSGRMDKWAPRLMDQGLRAMIGKGSRSEAVKEAIKQHTAVYLAATGGAGGFGGTETALAVHLLAHPVHLASLPVAVNIQCHAARHQTVIL